MDIESVIRRIEEYDYISFDVFDTLLLRPYARPTDLFRHMERNENVPGFADARISAERRARTKEKPEVELSEIYDIIQPEFAGLMRKEMEYEAQVLQPNPEMKRVFDLSVRKGKRVVLLSDMYLPSGFIADILSSRGFSGYEKLYVSNDDGKSKCFGDMFRKALEDLGIPPSELLHIGDDERSDGSTPSAMGIATERYEKVIERYLREHKRERRFYLKKRDLDRSVIVGTDALNWISRNDNNNYWHNLGYRYGGPVLTAFASFIDDNVKDKEGTILFVARDGYGPMRAYNILYGDVKNRYVYAARIFNILLGLNGRDYPGYEEKIVDHFSELGYLKSVGGDKKRFFSENRELFGELMSKELTAYGEYLRDGVKEGTVYVVDATTQKFSSQRLFESALGRNTVGLYYTMLSRNDVRDNRSFIEYRRVPLAYTRVDIPEFLMSSAEPPVSGMADGRPFFSEDVPEEERFRLSIINSVMEGEDEYARYVKSIFGEFVPRLRSNALEKWIESMTNNRTEEERKHLSELFWASDPAHSEYHGIVFSPKDTLPFILKKINDYYVSLRKRIR
jgi:predicted HAD superfamily hydrolase